MPPHRERRGASLRTSLAVSETVRNMVANRWLLAARLALAVAIGAGVATATVGEVAAIEQRFDDQVAAGRFVWVISSVGTPPILDATRCSALGDLTGLPAAGAVVGQASVVVATQPQARYDLYSITPDYPRVLWPDAGQRPARGGLLVGAAAAESLGLVDGSSLLVRDAPTMDAPQLLTVDRVMPPSPRDPGADRRLFVIAPVGLGETAECLVDADSANADDVPALLGAWFDPVAAPVAAPLRLADPVALLPESQLAQRASAWAWPVAATVLAILSFLAWYFRRSEFALYRVLGVSRAKLGLMLAAEHVIVAIVPVQTGVLLVTLLRSESVQGLAARLLLLDDARMVACLLIVPALALAFFRSRSTVDILKGC